MAGRGAPRFEGISDRPTDHPRPGSQPPLLLADTLVDDDGGMFGDHELYVGVIHGDDE